VCYEFNIKTTQFYDSSYKVHQCLKCQEYDYKIYDYCAQNHRSKHCSHKQARDMWKCETCQGTHKAFNSQCYKQQAKKKRIKRATKHRFTYYVVYEQKIIRTTTLMTQIKTFTSLESLVDNSLKRK